jgi:hypothetical protein
MTHFVRDDISEDLRHIRLVLPRKILNPVIEGVRPGAATVV